MITSSKRSATPSTELQQVVKPYQNHARAELTRVLREEDGPFTEKLLERALTTTFERIESRWRTHFSPAGQKALGELLVGQSDGRPRAPSEQALVKAFDDLGLGPTEARRALRRSVESVASPRADLGSEYVTAALIETARRYYARVSEGSTCEAISKLPRTDKEDLAWWSDHGPNHMRNVVERVPQVLTNVLRSGLIAPRSDARARFLLGLGEAMAVVHDIWMQDLSAAGRKQHAPRAAREVFTAGFDEAVAELAAGKLGRDLVNHYGIGEAEVPRVIRELLALCCTHSKSKVPREVLDNPAELRERLQGVLVADDDLTHPELAAQYGSIERFEAGGFAWLTANPALAADATDACRVLRLADALRWRSHDLRGSQGAPIGILAAGNKVELVMRLSDHATGRTYPVRYLREMMAGEANTAFAQVDEGGNLHFAIQSGELGRPEHNAQLASHTAHAFCDVFADYVGSFHGTDGRKVIVERPALEAPGFTEAVVRKMVEKDARLARLDEEDRIQIVSPSSVLHWGGKANDQAARFDRLRTDDARPAEWTPASANSFRALVHEGGINTDAMDFDRALAGSKRVVLKPGEILCARGTLGSWVYVPLSGDFAVHLGNNYVPAPARPGVPFGELSALSRMPHGADVVCVSELAHVVAIPRDVYLTEWVKGIYTHDDILPRLKQDFGPPA